MTNPRQPERTNDLLTTFGNRLREKREREQLSLRGAADQAGVALATYHRAERGGSVASASILKLVDWVGATPATLTATASRLVPMTENHYFAVSSASSALNHMSSVVAPNTSSEVAETLDKLAAAYVQSSTTADP